MSQMDSARIGEYPGAGGIPLKYRNWPADDPAQALIYLHGIESHSGWFAECAEKIRAMEISVYALDRRGAGMNSVERGHCNSYKLLVQDVAQFAASISGSHERLHLVALSWGGKLAVVVDLLFPRLFSSLSLIAPGFFSRVTPAASERIRIGFNMLCAPNALHPIPIQDDMFTAAPEHLDYIKNDPLRLHKVTAAFYRESLRIDRVLKKNNYQWTAPTQLLIAEHDVIINNQRLQTMFSLCRPERKRMLLYKGCRHSLQFERPDEVVSDIVEWIRKI